MLSLGRWQRLHQSGGCIVFGVPHKPRITADLPGELCEAAGRHDNATVFGMADGSENFGGFKFGERYVPDVGEKLPFQAGKDFFFDVPV